MKIITKLIAKYCKVKIEYTNELFFVNEYDPESNTITINKTTTRMIGATGLRFGLPWSIDHEIGHALVDKLNLHQRESVRKAFGSFNKRYDGTRMLFRSMITNEKSEAYITDYAAQHPEEDFAETFAYVLENWRYDLHSDNSKLDRKLKVITRIIEKVVERAS